MDRISNAISYGNGADCNAQMAAQRAAHRTMQEGADAIKRQLKDLKRDTAEKKLRVRRSGLDLA